MAMNATLRSCCFRPSDDFVLIFCIKHVVDDEVRAPVAIGRPVSVDRRIVLVDRIGDHTAFMHDVGVDGFAMPDPSGHEERGSNWNPNEQDCYRKFFSHRIEIANQGAVGCSVLLDAVEVAKTYWEKIALDRSSAVRGRSIIALVTH
jgi:hypothetical protein